MPKMSPRVAIAVSLTLVIVNGSGDRAAAEEIGRSLVGNTLSAVAYVARSPSRTNPSDLARFMFQAYLQGDGHALVRVWDTGRAAYTTPSLRRWSVAGSRLCLDLPAREPGPICADVHIWGPRIAGIGVEPYVMLDGDLEAGNSISVAR